MSGLRLLHTCVVLFCISTDAVVAQQPAEPPAPNAADQQDKPPAEAKEEQQAAADRTITKAKLEESKLREEVRKLRSNNEEKTDWSSVLTWFTSIFGVAIAVGGFGLNQLQKKKLEQDLYINERKHLIEVFKELGSTQTKVRMGAVAVLARSLRELSARACSENSQLLKDELTWRRRTVTSVLVSVTKFEEAEEIQKYIADNVAGALTAIVPEGTCECDMPSESPLKDRSFDFQGAKLTNAWWKRVDARNVDFYGATMPRASFREAFLRGAIFSKANLERAVFVDACLKKVRMKHANLKGARLVDADLNEARLQHSDLSDANLSGADFAGANLTGARLVGANLATEPGSDRITRMEGAILKFTDFDGANLCGVDFSKSVVKGCVSFNDIESDDKTILPRQ